MAFQIGIEQVQRRVPITVFHIDGSLNLGSADEFEQAAQKAVQEGARYVLLDFKDVPAVRSAGLRSVQILYNLLNPKDAASGSAAMREDEASKSPYLKLVNLSPDVHYVFDIAGFLRNLGAYDDLETALSSFG